jgi:putative transposase
MRDLMVLGIHLLVTLARLLRPGGVRAVVAESLILKHQLVIVGRSRRRAPNLTSFDRVVLGIAALFVSVRRIPQLAVILKPSTLFRLHRLLVDHKYRRLFSSSRPRRKPGPKGPAAELIAAIVEIKSRNPTFGHLRIAQQISHAFGVELDKDVVRRVLSKHYKPRTSGTDGPSWLTFLAQAKDSLWSVDLFRCESILLRSHWVMVVIDVFTRRLIGFGVEGGSIDGIAVCRMFNRAIANHPMPKRISTDHDPLFRFHRWLANLRVREIEEIKSVPYAPVSHPFVERLIGTIRHELLDRAFFWNATDLARKLDEFRTYYNTQRVHRALDGVTPTCRAGNPPPIRAVLASYRWQSHCRGLFQTPQHA